MMPEKSQIELKKVKELIDLMIQNDLVEVEVVDGENRILLKRPQPCQPQPVFTHTAMAAAPLVQTPPPLQLPAEKTLDQSLTDIKSPIVGTFYAAPSPDSEPYVTVGSRVNTETVVCIIEAMKVMNEIKAETSGTIVDVLCRAGQAVEYGQVIFKVKPD